MTPEQRIAQCFSVTPRWLWLVVTPGEQLAIDDALIARGIALSKAIRWESRVAGLYDLTLGAGVLDDVARETLGRTPSRVVEVDGTVPFDWRSFDGQPALERVMPTLPGSVAGPGPFRYFGTDESRPPYLWTCHESVGLQVGGRLDERDWHSWVDSLDRQTRSWPLREPW